MIIAFKEVSGKCAKIFSNQEINEPEFKSASHLSLYGHFETTNVNKSRWLVSRTWVGYGSNLKPMKEVGVYDARGKKTSMLCW